MLDGGVLGGWSARWPRYLVCCCRQRPPAICAAFPAVRRAQLLAYAASASLGCAAVERCRGEHGDPRHRSSHRRPHAAADTNASSSGSRPAKARTRSASLPRCASRLNPRPLSEVGDFRRRIPGRRLPGLSNTVSLHRSRTCPWHELPGRLRLVSISARYVPVAELLQAEKRLAPFCNSPGPIATLARCRRVSSVDRPSHLRVAEVRRSAVCPGLSTSPARWSRLSVDHVYSLASSHAASTHTLRQLCAAGTTSFTLFAEPVRPELTVTRESVTNGQDPDRTACIAASTRKVIHWRDTSSVARNGFKAVPG